MIPLERFEANLAKLRNNKCKVDAIVQRVQKDYEKQADLADRYLQEKQEQDWEKYSSK